MSNKYSEISNQLAKDLEAKMLRRIQSKIKSIVIKKIGKFLAVNLNEKKETKDWISNELIVTEQEFLKLKQDVSRLIEKTDFMLGSVAYLSEENDDPNKKIIISAEVKQNCLEEITKIKRNVHEIIKRQNFLKMNLNTLSNVGAKKMLKPMRLR